MDDFFLLVLMVIFRERNLGFFVTELILTTFRNVKMFSKITRSTQANATSADALLVLCSLFHRIRDA